MRFADIEFALETFIVTIGALFFIAVSATVAGLIFLFKAREKLRRLSAPPTRNSDGRLYRERE